MHTLLLLLLQCSHDTNYLRFPPPHGLTSISLSPSSLPPPVLGSPDMPTSIDLESVHLLIWLLSCDFTHTSTSIYMTTVLFSDWGRDFCFGSGRIIPLHLALSLSACSTLFLFLCLCISHLPILHLSNKTQFNHYHSLLFALFLSSTVWWWGSWLPGFVNRKLVFCSLYLKRGWQNRGTHTTAQ